MYNKAEKQQNLFSQSYTVHITPLVIDGLGGGHTHTHTRIHPHLKNQARAGLRLARAWFKKWSGHTIIAMHLWFCL